MNSKLLLKTLILFEMKMTHVEIIGAWHLCDKIIKENKFICDIKLEGFKLYGYKKEFLYVCDDVNELYAFLNGFTTPKRYIIEVE